MSKNILVSALSGAWKFVTLTAGWHVPKGNILVELPGGERKFITMQVFSTPIFALFQRDDGVDDPVFARLVRHFGHPCRALGTVVQLKWEALEFNGASRQDLDVLERKLYQRGLCLGIVLIKPTVGELNHQINRQLDDVRGQSYAGRGGDVR